MQLRAVQEKLTEARTQMQGYRSKLVHKYGHALRLCAFMVIAIGFERVLWEEMVDG
jgi:hypothetical protein